MKREQGASFLTLLAIRCLDFFFSLTALLALSPLLVLVAIALFFTGEGKVFYRQVRIGRGGREFNLLKFATMMNNSPAVGTGELTLPNDPRVLPLGRFLRKTKINEIPQLWNILVGDLSIIGPRPQTRRYYQCYREVDRGWIETLRPGLSGVGSILFRDEERMLACVNNPVEFDEQVIMPYKGEIECWFVANQSLILYIKLIVLTILVVIFPRRGHQKNLIRNIPRPPPSLEVLLDH